ncbi:DUF6900 domain-containing protein [Planktotalea sp.]|uniref:DUF6900 domain-containing protein n=1 Tax=Planktotalea sp. TaxID=2029877 RepID=UPI003D6BCA87
MTDPAPQVLEEIAAETLDLETLETRNSDDLDFHDMSVWQIKKALEAAFEAGKAANALEQCHA